MGVKEREGDGPGMTRTRGPVGLCLNGMKKGRRGKEMNFQQSQRGKRQRDERKGHPYKGRHSDYWNSQERYMDEIEG